MCFSCLKIDFLHGTINSVMVYQGQVLKIHSDFYYVNSDEKIHECKLREVLKKQKQRVVVGDFVEFEDEKITKILPRKNFIPRPAVSNVDQMIIVSAVKEPALDFMQLNRYICFAKYYNIPVKLCFNKNDLSQDDMLIERVFSIYEPLGYDIIFTSALEKSNIDDFIDVLKDKTTALCGNSGVGKSSLVNAINPNLNLRTGLVSEKTERGTHTTRHCEILKVTDDIKIVDTPGFSNLRFDFILPLEISDLFVEFDKYKGLCKYSDCLHFHEDGCAVLENLREIAETRYESYVAFVKEAQEYKEKVKYSGIKVETFSKEHNNKSMAKISARKRQDSRRLSKQKLVKEETHDEELY